MVCCKVNEREGFCMGGKRQQQCHHHSGERVVEWCQGRFGTKNDPCTTQRGGITGVHASVQNHGFDL